MRVVIDNLSDTICAKSYQEIRLSYDHATGLIHCTLSGDPTAGNRASIAVSRIRRHLRKGEKGYLTLRFPHRNEEVALTKFKRFLDEIVKIAAAEKLLQRFNTE